MPHLVPDSGAVLACRMAQLMRSLRRDVGLTSDHLLIVADACDEAETELLLSAFSDPCDRLVLQEEAGQARAYGDHLRALADRYATVPLPCQPIGEVLPIETIPDGALASLPTALAQRLAYHALLAVTDRLRQPVSDEERQALERRLRTVATVMELVQVELEILAPPEVPGSRQGGRHALRLLQPGDDV